MRVAYLDASAVVKLVIPEAESAQLLEFVRGLDRAISSELTVIEVGRAAARADGSAGLSRAAEVCRRLDLQPIDSHIIDRARQLKPATVRSLGDSPGQRIGAKGRSVAGRLRDPAATSCQRPPTGRRISGPLSRLSDSSETNECGTSDG